MNVECGLIASEGLDGEKVQLLDCREKQKDAEKGLKKL